ncbi:MAG: phosphodiester glycosidase family protein [Flavobacterium sp.]|nr:phosphodiester glycosidase family protein [Flavobacterium sp.]
MKKIFPLLLLNVLVVSAQNITWTNISSNYNMPNGVKVYSGEDASIPLKLKYLDVDLNNTDLELTPVLSKTPTNAKNWANNLGAIAVMNGGYFGGSNSYSAIINNTVEAKNVASLTRKKINYPVTRGFFGLNSDGTMAVNWIYHFGNAKTDIYSYATPTPNSDGNSAATPTKAEGIQWTNLAKGMGAGPVLIKNENIVNTYTEEVFWGSGVSNIDLEPRSSIGYTNNKHVILLVVDGRQEGVSAGVSLPQLASILKNLGCIDALNCDGGGSSQLATPNAFINTPSESYRSIPSVWAIYKK